jgi:hypothetical protein
MAHEISNRAIIYRQARTGAAAALAGAALGRIGTRTTDQTTTPAPDAVR